MLSAPLCIVSIYHACTECVHLYNISVGAPAVNHFESNAASATDKENITRGTTHQVLLIHWVRARIVVVNNRWFELLADSSRQHTACVHT